MTDIDSLTRHYAKDITVLKSEYTIAQRLLEKFDAKKINEHRKLNQLRSQRDEVQESLSEIQEEIDCDPLPESSQPLSRIQKRDIIQMQLDQLEIALTSAQQVAETVQQEVEATESKLLAADKKINDYLGQLDNPQLAITMKLEIEKERSKRISKMDDERLKKLRKNDYGHDVIQKLKTQEAATSKAQHKIAVQRLQSALDVTKTVKDVVQSHSHEIQEKRKLAEAEFATDIAKVEALIATNAEKHVRKVQTAKKRLNDEKDDMIKRGLNPYVEFRKQEFDEDAKKREKRMKDRVEENKTKLMEMLIQEEEDQLHREAHDQRIKNYEQSHRAEQGRHYIEDKNQKYIESMTIGNQDILDPTGRALHVFPSKVTDIPDHSFGLGKSSRISDDIKQRIIEKVQAKLGVGSDDVGEYDRLIHSMKVKLSSTQPVESDEMQSDDAMLMTSQSSSDLHSKCINVLDLSKFEKDSLQRTRDKHKQRLAQGETQVVNGRTYTGKGFVSKPHELVFQDFEVGKTYHKRFILTNASYSFNSFKILDFDSDIAEYFTLLYDRPGRMSAGVSCNIEIIFKPSMNEDIITSISMLCDTGPTEIPIRCLIKRCDPKVMNYKVDLGSVIVGQRAKSSVKIMNSQAIGTDVIITRIEDSMKVVYDDDHIDDGDATSISSHDHADIALEQQWLVEVKAKEIGTRAVIMNDYSASSEQQLQARVDRVISSSYQKRLSSTPYALSTNKHDVYLNGYDTINIDVIGEPLRPGRYEQDFLLTFPQAIINTNDLDDHHDVNKVRQLQEIISTSMICDRLPIEVTTPVIDMKCCYYNRIYRQHCQLHNHGKISYRVNVCIDEAFKSYVDINPSTIIIQAHETVSLQIKFTPTKKILQRLSYYTIWNHIYLNTGAMMLPIRLDVHQQSIPLYFTIRSIVTSSAVILSKSTLQYGDCYVNQQAIMTITITNPSILPQKIAFTKLKKEMCISPHDGFAVILPNESIDFQLAFTPMSAISYKYEMMIVSSVCDEYPIQVFVNGIEAPIMINHNIINLRTTAPGERVVESSMITNTSSTPQSVEIIIPERLLSWMRISPYILELQPGEKQRVEIEYLPPIDALELILQPKEWYKDTLYQIMKLRNAEDRMKLDDRCALNNWHEYDKDDHNMNSMKTTIASGAFGEIHWIPAQEGLHQSIIGKWIFPIFFQPLLDDMNKDNSIISPNTMQPPLYMRIESTVTSCELEASSKMLDFGSVSIGSSITRRVTLTNHSSNTISLSCSIIDAMGAYSIRNALRPIAPGASHEVIIMCQPKHSAGILSDALEFSGADNQGGHRVRIQLRCQAISPIIEIAGVDAPPYGWDVRGGIVDFHDVVVSDIATRSFTVTNTQSTMKQVHITSSKADRTISNLFSYKPDRFDIPALGSQVVEVSFKPTAERMQLYREEIVVVIGKEDCVRIGLVGRGWSRQLIVTAVDPMDDPIGRITHNIIKDVLESTTSSAAVSCSADNEVDVESSRNKNRNMIPSLLSAARSKISSSINEYAQTTKTLSYTLVYPDLFSCTGNLDPTSYSTIMSAEHTPDQSSVLQPKEKTSKQALSQGTNMAMFQPIPGSRQQCKKLVIAALKLNDNRKVKTPGSYEVVLSTAAKQSNRFHIIPEKGSLSSDGSVVVDIVFTQPPPIISEIDALIPMSPKSVEPSIICVNYEAEIVLKGGWTAPGDNSEKRILIILRAPAPPST